MPLSPQPSDANKKKALGDCMHDSQLGSSEMAKVTSLFWNDVSPFPLLYFHKFSAKRTYMNLTTVLLLKWLK